MMIKNMGYIQNELVKEINRKLSEVLAQAGSGKMRYTLKDDKSLVTEIDSFVSTLIKEKLHESGLYSNYVFYSEEDYSKLTFPSIVLDPIDGTRDLVRRRAECAVSLAVMSDSSLSSKENFGWIYNPFSGFSLSSDNLFCWPCYDLNKKLIGMVSRTEQELGLFEKKFKNSEVELDIVTRGSIAFKLGLLASGACDFVISLAPKNIWDIAAGTILCSKRNINFYQDFRQVENLNEPAYKGILLWAPLVIKDQLQEMLFHK